MRSRAACKTFSGKKESIDLHTFTFGHSHNGEELAVVRRAEPESKTVDIDNRLRKGLRSFLRQVVTNAALDIAVRIFA